MARHSRGDFRFVAGPATTMGCGGSKQQPQEAQATEQRVGPGEGSDASGGEEKKKKHKKHKRKQPMEKREKKAGAGMLNALALQFPVINRSFQTVWVAFERHHSSGDGIKEMVTYDHLGDVLRAIATEKEFTDEEVKELFHVSSLTSTEELSFKEFIIAMAMGYYLKVESDDEEFRKISRGFKVVEKAFHDIDADGGGTIDAAELKEALFATSQENEEVLEMRFKELDFDGDGDISLPEFIFGMVSWVGFADDLEEGQ